MGYIRTNEQTKSCLLRKATSVLADHTWGMDIQYDEELHSHNKNLMILLAWQMNRRTLNW